MNSPVLFFHAAFLGNHLIICLMLLWSTGLCAQAKEPVQVSFEGKKYWQFESVDTFNNTPFKFYYMYDKKGKCLGWVYEFPRDGEWINFYKEDSGKVASKFTVKDSLLNGRSTQYRFDGTKESEYDFTRRLEDGFVRYWNRKGVLTLEHFYELYTFQDGYEDSRRAGEWRSWYSDGKIRKVEHFSENEPDGIQVEYYDNGQVMREEFYIKGERDSFLTLLHPNGRIQSRTQYKAGKFVTNNPHQEFHPNGNLSGTGDLEDAQKTGKWTYFYENTRKESEGEYGTYIYHHEHGDFPMSHKAGHWIYWYENGQIKAAGDYATEEIDYFDFSVSIDKASAKRLANWKFYNTKGEEISQEAFEKTEKIDDY